MEFFNPNSKIDFMGARRWTACLSVMIFLVSIGALCINGLVWGLDFTGGTQIQVTYPNNADLPAIRDSLAKNGFKDVGVISYGNAQDVLISTEAVSELEQTDLVDKVMHALPQGAVKQGVEFVGPQVGQELATKGALAILVSLLATMIYIALRFEYRLAVSSAVALIHDPVLILGVFSMFHIEFDLKALAGLLAVIGYSLNDTIVVFDRVRENLIKYEKSKSILEIFNLSIFETLNRSIITSFTVIIIMFSLFLFGSGSIKYFSLALVIGIAAGTYSSIFIATPIVLFLKKVRK